MDYALVNYNNKEEVKKEIAGEGDKKRCVCWKGGKVTMCVIV